MRADSKVKKSFKENRILKMICFDSAVNKSIKKSSPKKIIDIHNVIRQGKNSCVKRAIANKQNLNLPEDIS